MTLGLTHLRFAAVALVFAAVLLTGRAALAFSMSDQGSTTNADGSAKFADPDDNALNSLFGGSGSSVQFGAPRSPDSSQGNSNWPQGNSNWPQQPSGSRPFGSGNND